MNRDTFIQTFRATQWGTRGQSLEAFIDKVRAFDAANGTGYSLVVGELLEVPEKPVDEQVPFNLALFPALPTGVKRAQKGVSGQTRIEHRLRLRT
jgi:hypothetical protein